MPKLDGITMLMQLRQMPEFKQIPVLMVTAGPKSLHGDALGAGANVVLRKPIDFDLFFATIGQLLAA